MFNNEMASKRRRLFEEILDGLFDVDDDFNETDLDCTSEGKSDNDNDPQDSNSVWMRNDWARDHFSFTGNKDI